MEVRKLVHIFNDSNETHNLNGWEIRCHPLEQVGNRIQKLDEQEGTAYYKDYQKISEQESQDEFYKYITLYHEGGIFARYEKVDEIPLVHLQELTAYCNNRQISLFQCPSCIIVGFVHHAQLLSMVSDEIFHPLSSLYKKTENSQGHKTLVTSLTLSLYLEKIRGHSERSESSGSSGNSERSENSESSENEIISATPEKYSKEFLYGSTFGTTFGLITGTVIGILLGMFMRKR